MEPIDVQAALLAGAVDATVPLAISRNLIFDALPEATFLAEGVAMSIDKRPSIMDVFMTTQPTLDAKGEALKQVVAAFHDQAVGLLRDDTNLPSGNLLTALGASLFRISLGFLIGTSLALVVGCLVGWYKTIEYLVDPLIEAVRPMMIAGLFEPSDCRMTFDDEVIHGTDRRRGMVFQQDAVFPWMTVARNISYGPRLRGASTAEQRLVEEKWVELVGLGGFADRWPWELSGAMHKRVDLGRVYAKDPNVLLIDEPFGALDAQTK